MKTYKINGKEIEEIEVKRKIPLEKHEFSTRDSELRQKFNQLLEALSEKKEEPKSKRDLYDNPEKTKWAMRSDTVYKQICKLEPKSTLREEIKGAVRLRSNDGLVADKILELMKSHLLQEIKKAEPLRLQGESTDFTQGQEWTMRQIKQIIKNL